MSSHKEVLINHRTLRYDGRSRMVRAEGYGINSRMTFEYGGGVESKSEALEIATAEPLERAKYKSLAGPAVNLEKSRIDGKPVTISGMYGTWFEVRSEENV